LSTSVNNRWLATRLIGWLVGSLLGLGGCMVVGQTLTPPNWWGVVLFGAICGCILSFSLSVLALTTAKNRRPGETFGQWFSRELSGSRDGEYYYAELTCNCIAQLRCPEPPEPGTTVWCPGHNRFGPAQSALVMAVDQHLRRRGRPAHTGVHVD
jgi:hypothetical protein